MINSTARARRLRREQTPEEKELWRLLRAGRFAGFKFRRQHPVGRYFLDFYCPAARLSIELDGSQHGSREHREYDQARSRFLQENGIEEMRIWNSHWQHNREGLLLDIWTALHRRTGCTAEMRRTENHRFIAPDPRQLIEPASSPRPSPPIAEEREIS